MTDHDPAAVSTTALRGLAHPLRVKILDLITTHGSLTASRLGELLGESSGSTSYHLRQLEKHGFVREVQGKGTARERWWERSMDRMSISEPDAPRDDPARQAATLVNTEFERARQEKIWATLRYGDRLPEEWRHVGTLSTHAMRLTPEELRGVIEAWEEFARVHLEPLRGRDGQPGTRAVQVHFNAFPVVGPEDVATGPPVE